jgi:spermidine/putrescine transport system substrate-binding protein
VTASLTRRQFLVRAAGAGAGTLGLGAYLAACAESGGSASTFGGNPSGILNFANWPLYIDKMELDNGRSVRPSLEEFTADTGILVNYREVIQESDWFFEKIEPRLAAGQPTGWDLMVITNGITLTKMIELGYLVELPTDDRPNFDTHVGSFVKSPPYDPGNRHTMAWQSGVTGIAYNPDLTGRPITSLRDLFSAEFEGKVGMFGDIVDMPNLALLAIGVSPEESTPDDWVVAADLLAQQKASHVLRDYYQQNYINALKNGDVALTMAWSGDIFSAKLTKNLPEQMQFVVPDDGALLWTDNMCIPKGAVHLADAMAYMDFVYQPKIAAQIAQFVNFISPVPAAKPLIEQMATQEQDAGEAARLQEVASSPLVFPTEDEIAKLHTYRELKTDAEASAWDDIFRSIYRS